MIFGEKGKLIGRYNYLQQLGWRRGDSERWIGTITIEMAKNKYLKTKGRFS